MVAKAKFVKESFADIRRQFDGRVIAFMDKRNGFPGGVHNHPAVAAPGHMRLNFLAKPFASLAIQIIIQQTQQLNACH